MKQQLEKNSAWVFPMSFVGIFIWLQMRVQGILPAIMQDEYVYSMQARKVPLAELDYPNYLYSWVYSLTDTCTVNFYSCTKNLNLVFFAAFIVIVFWLANRFLGKWFAFAIAAATALSPLSTFTSVFMPESMYFAFAALSLVLLLWASGDFIWWKLALAGTSLGLTALVKPHALFILIAAVIFLLWTARRNIKTALFSSAAFSGATLLVKFALGFIFAGVNGLTLFGSSYTSSVTTFTENLQSLGLTSSLVASGESVIAASPTTSSLLGFVQAAMFQFAWQSSAVALIAIGSVVAIVKNTRKAKPSGQNVDLDIFNVLVIITLATMVLTISVFAAMVTISGDDHSNRLLLRYYEFLFPLLAIGAIANLKRSEIVRPKVALAVGLVGAGLAVLSFSAWLPDLRQMFADSPIMMGITASTFNLGLSMTLMFAGLLVALLNIKRSAAIFSAIALSGSAVFGVSSLARLHDQASVISPIDEAGLFARDFFKDEDPGAIYFLGNNKQLTLASIFALDKPGVGYQLVDSGHVAEVDSLPESIRWVVQLPGTELIGDISYRVLGDGWIVNRVNSANEYVFRQAMLTSPVSSVVGIQQRNSWGAWNAEPFVKINFSSPLPANVNIFVEILVGPSSANSVAQFQVGDSSIPVQLGNAGEVLSGDIQFENSSGSDSLTISIPGLPQESLGLISIRVNN